MTTCAEWQTKLDAYNAALESSILGQQVVSIRVGEKETKFSPANIAGITKLRDIAQREVDKCNGVVRTGGGVVHITPIDR